MQPSPVVDDRLRCFPPVALPSAIRHDRTRPRCGMGYIARRLGREHLQVPSLITRIRQLIRSWGFPPPVTPRLYRGEWLTGAPAVGSAAQWDKGMVDCWFDDRMPPELRAIAEQDDVADAAELLDARAAALGLRR